MLIRFILLPFLIFTSFAASAALTTVPLRQVWSLSTDDVVSVNTSTRIATATAYVPNASGTIYRIKATASGYRLLTVAEESIVGGKGNAWLTGALLAANLTYEGYQWYKSFDTTGYVAYGQCGGNGISGSLMTLDDCKTAITTYLSKSYTYPSGTYTNTGITITQSKVGSKQVYTDDGQLKDFDWLDLTTKYTYFDSTGHPYNTTGSYWFEPSTAKKSGIKEKEPISDDEVSALLLSSLSNQSSRQAFGDGNQPYPLDGLFTDSDLSVDPTYAPQADITTDNIKDFIDKYNVGSLQTSDPSANNYVTPSQYQYIKSQAEQAAATAAGGSPSTNPLEGMEQPITQKQYDESNKKTDEAAANNIKSTDWTGVDTASKGGDGANDALDKMAKGIDPTLPVLLLPDLPKYSACRTIDLTWKGYPAVFPSSSQCIKMEEFKTNLGYFLYLLTAVGIILELLRRVE